MNTTRALTLFLALTLFALVFLALATPTARAAPPVILRVTVTGATSDLSCGTSWANPCGLQHALTTVAITGTELWVAAGTYTPTTGTDRTATFRLRNDIALYGGFAGSETSRTQRNFTANVTILSGDINEQGDSFSYDNSYHVVTGSGVTNTAVLDGFTVTDGNANAIDNMDPNSRGGGMYDEGGSPTLTNVTFSSNSAGWDGGGIYNYAGNPTLTNITFTSNTSGYLGGGMSNHRSDLMLTNVTFSGNSGLSDGGGMYNYLSSPTLTNVTFSNNSACSGGGMRNSYSYPKLTNVTFTGNSGCSGGGMYNDASSPTLTNVTFSGNSVWADGGGMFNFNNSWSLLSNVTFSDNSAVNGGGMYNWGSSPTLTNTTFISNTASASGGGTFNYWNWSSNPTVRNTILWGNTATSGAQIFNDTSTPSVSDSVVQGDYSGGTNIITADPRLGALGNYGGNTETVPLLPGSSAINAGNGSNCSATDQRNKPRVGTCDIGAFESQGFTLAKTSGDNQSTLPNTPFAAALRVTVSGASGEPVDGGVVTFTAPSSGASATPVTSTVTIASGAASQTLTANGILGPYAVTANASGATAPVAFALTNTNWLFHLPLIRR